MVTNMCVAGNESGFLGLSTDIKPTSGVQIGSTFYEYDTRNSYIFDGTTWWIM